MFFINNYELPYLRKTALHHNAVGYILETHVAIVEKSTNCTKKCETTCLVDHPTWACCVCIEELAFDRARVGRSITIDDLKGKRGSLLFHSLEKCPKVKDCRHCGGKFLIAHKDHDLTEEDRCVFNLGLQKKVDQQVLNGGQERFYKVGRHTAIKANQINK